MGTLQGSDRSPYQATRRLSDEQKKEMTNREKQFYQERLQAWKDFRAGPLGDTCVKIAEAKMTEYMGIVMAPVAELCQSFGLAPSEVDEIRAEYRGRYTDWYEILHEPEAIFEKLARMQVEEAARTVAKTDLIHPPHVGKVLGAR